jgi:hypothetical protein
MNPQEVRDWLSPLDPVPALQEQEQVNFDVGTLGNIQNLYISPVSGYINPVTYDPNPAVPYYIRNESVRQMNYLDTQFALYFGYLSYHNRNQNHLVAPPTAIPATVGFSAPAGGVAGLKINISSL